MNKKILLTFLASLTMVFSVETMNMCEASSVTVPIKRDEQSYFLKNGDGTELVHGDGVELLRRLRLRAYINTETGDLNAYFPDLEDGWSYFVVLIDSKYKGQIDMKYLNWVGNNYYKCTFNLPHYCDVLDLHVYKQKNTDPEFTIKEQNFIGRTKVYSNHFHDFLRPNGKQQLTLIPKNGNNVTNKEIHFVPRLTSNYYSLLYKYYNSSGVYDPSFIGKIILPNGQGKSLTEDDLIVNSNYFYRYDENGQPITGAIDNFNCFNFYLPDDVTNFKFQIFEDKIGKDTDVLYEVDVNLNRT